MIQVGDRVWYHTRRRGSKSSYRVDGTIVQISGAFARVRRDSPVAIPIITVELKRLHKEGENVESV